MASGPPQASRGSVGLKIRTEGRFRKVLLDGLKNLFRFFGLGLVRFRELERLRQYRPPDHDLAFILGIGKNFPPGSLESFLPKSRSQLRQDLFVLGSLGFPRGGFFVEFGATDGVGLSNSYLLETEFGWSGIVAEPARGWSKALRENRLCAVDTRCVWSESGKKLSFNETNVGELSTVDIFSGADAHAEDRKGGRFYEVETVSLLDLLVQHSAPDIIDYLSVDTEGSELEILDSFDFSRYSFRVITVEHNFTSQRSKIKKLLERNGYRRVHEEVSQFDDWYVGSQSGLQHSVGII